MNIIGVLLAAGSGTRTQLNTPKQILPIKGKFLFQYTLENLIEGRLYENIIIVASKETKSVIQKIIKKQYKDHPIRVISGGITRQISIKKSIEHVLSKKMCCDFILFQDAARPLVTQKDYKRVINYSLKNDGAILVEPIRGSISISIQNQKIKDHSTIFPYLTHSPECYKFKIIKAIYETPTKKSTAKMTNLELMLENKKNVFPVISHNPNLKVTYPEDILSIQKLLL